MNQYVSSYEKISHSQILLKVSYGLLYIIAGADKFFNLVTDWQKYVNPKVLNLLHLNYSSFKVIIALIEITLGIMVLTKFTRIGAYAIATWFTLIVLNLLTMWSWSYLDIAARDVVLATGAIALAWLSEAESK